MPAANLYQVVLGATCLEITPEPVADNATSLIPWSNVSGISPVSIQEKPSGDDTWTYRFNSVVVIMVVMTDGNHMQIELQEVTNQPGWTGDLAGQKAAVGDLSGALATTPIPPPPFAILSQDGVHTHTFIGGLNYNEGSGPSADSSTFGLYWENLSPIAGNITITPSNGNVQIFNPSNSIWYSVAFNIGYLAATNSLSGFKVRMKAGLSDASYSTSFTVTAPNTAPFVLVCSGVVSAAEVQYEFVTEPINLSPAITTRDGTRIFSNVLTGRQWYVGGWDPTQWPVTLSTNQQWYSDDGGVTVIQAADAPWSERHNFGLQMRSDGYVILFGGDNQSGPPPKDSWLWNPNTELWTNVTMDWGSIGGSRVGYGHTIDSSNNIYMIDGSTDANIVKSTNNGATWSVFCTIPVGYETANGYSCWHNEVLYVVCGGGGSHPERNFKVSSTGVFTALPDLTGEIATRTSWCELVSFKNKLFFIDGTGIYGNTTGVRVSSDGAQTWTKLGSFPMRGSHARGVAPLTYLGEESIYIITGNGADDTNRIKAITYEPLTSKCLYSVTKANPSYSGSCIRVARDSDYTETDIGFTDNELDTTSLLAFVGSNNGFVTKWYDQSGNGYDLSESNYLYWPLIVSAGILITDNGKAAINFDTTSKKLALAANINLTSKYSISTVMNLDAGNKIFLLGDNSNAYGIFNYSGASVVHSNGNVNLFSYTSGANGIFTTGSQKLLELYRNRQSMSAFENAVFKEMFVNGSGPSFGNYWDTDMFFSQIGQEYGFGYAFTGKIQELNIKCGVIEPNSHVAIEEDINLRFSIY